MRANRARWQPALLVLALTAWGVAACGGGDSSSGGGGGPVGPPAKFSNASLSGKYAFSMTGTEECNGSGSFFARIGSFTADGNGRITTGLEDGNFCTGVETLDFTGGTYSIGADGRGSLSLNN